MSATRALSERQAAACEQACTPRCRCRCGGAFHGRKRNGDAPPSREWLERLPEGDPHKLPKKTGRRKLKPFNEALGDLFGGRS